MSVPRARGSDRMSRGRISGSLEVGVRKLSCNDVGGGQFRPIYAATRRKFS